MPGPLEGLRILDFTWALAGPYGSMILTDLGADVYKVEHVETNERHRGAGPYVHGVSTYFFQRQSRQEVRHARPQAPRGRADHQRSHRSQPPEAIDVLTENFRPGAMARLGLGYDDLSAVNPRLIYASTSGFGHTGPYQHRPAVDVIVQGMGGVMSITGHPGGPPARPGYSHRRHGRRHVHRNRRARRDARARILRPRTTRRRRYARRPGHPARERRRPRRQHRRSPRPDRHAPPSWSRRSRPSPPSMAGW